MLQSAKRIVLASRPYGVPTKENFREETLELAGLAEGEVLVESLYVSVDPYMRGRMNDTKSYVPPYAIDDAIAGGVIARVIESRAQALTAGDIVLAGYGWQTHAIVKATHVQKIEQGNVPLSAFLGAVGMTGLTAYFGLLSLGKPKAGETVVVSGAAGAVGSIVGQIANIVGARVVGVAGSDAKCQWLREIGFDEAVNYKHANFREQLALATPNGVDVYFDNVGGDVSDAVLRRINHGARIPVCGQIATYNETAPVYQTPIQGLLLINSATMTGFIVSDFRDQFAKGISELSSWVESGQIQYEETIVQGFENTVEAFLMLFQGGNTGKLLVKVKE
nr:NADP-dependent oxidoreductase [Bacilli bacterium]